MLRPVLLSFLFCAVAAITSAALPAQERATPSSTGEKLALEQGRAALAAGRHAEAAGHFFYALTHSEDPATVLGLLLENAHGDADAALLWSIDLAAWQVEANGRLNLPEAWREFFSTEELPFELAKARALALREVQQRLRKLAKGRKAGNRIEVEWLEDLARVLAEPSPRLQEATADLGPEIRIEPADWARSLANLKRLATSLVSSGQWTEAVRAARALRGLATQAGFGKDLMGPKAPDLSSEGSTANDVLRRARAALHDKEGMALTLEELESMNLEEQRELTVERASFGKPAVTHSPRGWYRVETSCGWETLYGTATTVELHHQRLVGWYGRDPFENRPGLVRIVPEAHGLEAEGTPYWWAGGFQGGDTTVLQFTMSTIPGLGRGLTHELTHRFDGGMYGGLPGWLSEGRASWTAGAYGSMHDKEFVANHCSFGTMESTWRMGYGGEAKLRELVDGSLEEYRDNYTAGYALFMFLNTWSGEEEGGEQLFHDRLQKFMQEKKRLRNDPIEVFEYYFADGEDGRPEGFAAFAEAFQEYLKGFYWKEPAEWRDRRYTQSTPPGDPAPRVYDEPTWTWLRSKAEPFFGQIHVRQAAQLFAELGKAREAVDAFHWCLQVDEPSLDTLLQLEQQLLAAGNPDAAWMVRHWPRFRAAAGVPVVAPFARDLDDLRALLDMQEEAARALAASSPLSAAALAGDRDRVAQRLGLPALEDLPVEQPAAPPPLHPFDAPTRLLGAAGWSEVGMTGLEDRRVAGLWYQDPGLSMHVGRREARGGTGKLDRTAHWRDAVVLADRWLEPGRYRIRSRVEATTAYMSGGLVFGWTRRDRNFRLGFSMGDYNYAIGKEEHFDEIDGVHWSLTGLYPRIGSKSGTLTFGSERNHFELEILVDGPTAEIFMDGKPVALFSTVDGSSIQGRIGYYTSNGALKAQATKVQRLDRSAAAPGGSALGGGLNPRRRGADRWRDLIGRPVTDLPLAPSGEVLLWFPEQSETKLDGLQDGDWYERVADAMDSILDVLDPELPSQALLIVVPPSFPQADVDALREDFGAAVAGGLHFARHFMIGRIEEDGRTLRGWTSPVLGFIDPAGFLRYAQRQSRFSNRLDESLRHLILQHQDHSRPGTAGAGD